MTKNRNFMKELKKWAYRNAFTLVLALVFVFLFIASKGIENAFAYFGATGMAYMNGEYYRWIACLFLHANLRHLLANCMGLLSAGSLLSPFLKKRQMAFLFLVGGVLAEIAYSIVVTEPVYDIGASSGIFALIACLMVCFLRFPQWFRLKWYRPDFIIVVLYFIFANSSVSSFLVHTFGFAAGILISFIMVTAGRIERSPEGRTLRKRSIPDL